MASATEVLRRPMRGVMKDIRDDTRMREGIIEMRKRRDEIGDKLRTDLMGVAMVPEAREHFDRGLDEMWASETARDADEIIIGGGLHAAIYSAVRVKQGFPRPLVIEANATAGGIFNCSGANPSFYLNSRNRPGRLDTPGRSGALNYLPGAVVQPSDLSGAEYQRNSDLAFAIRATLAASATVVTGVKVTGIEEATGAFGTKRSFYVRTTSGGFSADRVIIATGLGEPKRVSDADGERVMSFPRFMAHMGAERFPLRGMTRVAVIGCGDSGRTTVEALVGQSPQCGWSVASLDWPTRIDWYGSADQATSRERWQECNRSRYRGIGRHLYSDATGENRVYARGRAGSVSSGFECATVNTIPYDLVIDCTGFEQAATVTPEGWEGTVIKSDGNDSRRIARQYAMAGDDLEVYEVGPAAGIDFNARERENLGVIAEIPENSTAIFRYADRTAALAAKLTMPSRARRPGSRVVRTVASTLTTFEGEYAPLSPTMSRTELGRDVDGKPIYVGSTVTAVNSPSVPRTGPVLGVCDGENDRLIGARVLASEGVTVGGFTVNGERAWGLKPRQWRVVDATSGQSARVFGREFLGTGQNGEALYAGSLVTSGSTTGVLLGRVDNDQGLASADEYFVGIETGGIGGFKVNGRTVFGVLPGSCVLVRTATGLRDRTGRELFTNDLIKCESYQMPGAPLDAESVATVVGAGSDPYVATWYPGYGLENGAAKLYGGRYWNMATNLVRVVDAVKVPTPSVAIRRSYGRDFLGYDKDGNPIYTGTVVKTKTGTRRVVVGRTTGAGTLGGADEVGKRLALWTGKASGAYEFNGDRVIGVRPEGLRVVKDERAIGNDANGRPIFVNSLVRTKTPNAFTGLRADAGSVVTVVGASGALATWYPGYRFDGSGRVAGGSYFTTSASSVVVLDPQPW